MEDHAVADPFQSESLDTLATRLLTKWRRIAGHRQFPLDLVDDAASEAWIKMLKGRHTLRDFAQFEAWANAIFINCMFNLLGKVSEQHHVDSLDREGAPSPVDRELTPEARVLRDEMVKDGLAALATLTPRERLVWERFEHQGDAAADIATELHITANRVRHIAMNVRRRLWDATCPGRRRPILRHDERSRQKPAAASRRKKTRQVDRACNTWPIFHTN